MAFVLTAVVPVSSDNSQQLARPDDSARPKAAWDVREDQVARAESSLKDDVTERSTLPHHMGLVQYWHDKPMGALMLTLAALDNGLAYAAYFTANSTGERMYSIVDSQLALVPWLFPALIFFACVGTASFVALVIVVECLKLPRFHTIMNLRIYFSAMPCAFLCGVIVYYSDQSKPVSFAALIVSMVFAFAWCLYMRLRWSFLLSTCTRTTLDLSWLAALTVVLFLTILVSIGRMDIVTKSSDMDCPYAANIQMPVNIPMLDRWFCSPWDESSPTKLSRPPVEAEPRQLLCSDTYVDTFGVSIEPHLFQCPAGCLLQYPGSGLVGCGAYSLDSPLCVAAIHSGALTDAGGTTVVYGRLGLAEFERCSRNSLTSEERHVTASLDNAQVVEQPGSRRLAAAAPVVLSSDGVQVPQAFHFNNFPDLEEYLWLKEWRVLDGGVDAEQHRPWAHIEATISARVAGLVVEDEKVRLGSPDVQPALFGETATGCRLERLGIACPGAAWTALRLDFCLPDEGACLEA